MDINKANSGVDSHTFREARQLDENLNKYISNKYGRKYKFRVSVEGCMLYSAYPEYQNDIYHITEYEKIYYGCRAGRTKLEIYPNGDVYPCICFENCQNPTSNILDNTLADIWYKDYNMNKLRARKCINNKCMECGYYVICNGGCPALRTDFGTSDTYEEKDARCLIGEQIH